MDSAGDPGGEFSALVSSCKRYFIGESGFLGLDGWLDSAGGEAGRLMADREILMVSIGVAMFLGDLMGSEKGFWKKSSLVGEGQDLEFCLAGDSEDNGSDIIVSVRDIVRGQDRLLMRG